MYDNFEYEELETRCKRRQKPVRDFLTKFDLKLDDVDYSIIVRENNEIIATISKNANLVKGSAISPQYAGKNILNTLMTKIFLKISSQGYKNAFLITKRENRSKFIELGLYEVYSNDKIIYFTNNLNNLNTYIDYLKNVAQQNNNKVSCAIVMNCNPFTLGHQYLLETASNENELVYLIPVLEDSSFFTYKERIKMIEDSCLKFKNVVIVEGSDYLISKSTFPSYFLKNKDEIVREQCKLDVGLFLKLYCENLNIKKRYVGTEPFSRTTEIYNKIIKEMFSFHKLELIELERLTINESIVSASKVREAIYNGDDEVVKMMTPTSEQDFLLSNEIKKRASKNKTKIFKKN